MLAYWPTPQDIEHPDNPWDGLTPADLDPKEVAGKARAATWRERHQADREAHRDPVFSAVLATNSHTPSDPAHRRATVAKRAAHPLANVPVQDLIFTATCIDGPFDMTGREVQILMSARRLGVLPIVDTTRKMLRDVIDGWC